MSYISEVRSSSIGMNQNIFMSLNSKKKRIRAQRCNIDSSMAIIEYDKFSPNASISSPANSRLGQIDGDGSPTSISSQKGQLVRFTQKQHRPQPKLGTYPFFTDKTIKSRRISQFVPPITKKSKIQIANKELESIANIDTEKLRQQIQFDQVYKLENRTPTEIQRYVKRDPAFNDMEYDLISKTRQRMLTPLSPGTDFASSKTPIPSNQPSLVGYVNETQSSINRKVRSPDRQRPLGNLLENHFGLIASQNKSPKNLTPRAQTRYFHTKNKSMVVQESKTHKFSKFSALMDHKQMNDLLKFKMQLKYHQMPNHLGNSNEFKDINLIKPLKSINFPGGSRRISTMSNMRKQNIMKKEENKKLQRNIFGTITRAKLQNNLIDKKYSAVKENDQTFGSKNKIDPHEIGSSNDDESPTRMAQRLFSNERIKRQKKNLNQDIFPLQEIKPIQVRTNSSMMNNNPGGLPQRRNSKRSPGVAQSPHSPRSPKTEKTVGDRDSNGSKSGSKLKKYGTLKYLEEL